MQPPCFCAFPKMQEKKGTKNTQNNPNHFNLRSIPECASKGTSNIKSYFNSFIASRGKKEKKKKLDWGNLTGQAADVTREGCFLTTRLQPNAAHQHVSAFSHCGGAQAERGSCFHPDWVKFPLWRENVNVSFTPVLSFIMIKQFILREKGAKRNAGSRFIHRLSCFIRALVILYHAPLSGRQEARLCAQTNLSYSAFSPPFLFFIFFISFLSFPHHRLSSLLLAYSFFTCDCRPVKVILNQSNPL